MDFLQQGCSSSQPLQTAPQTVDQVFKDLKLLGTFLIPSSTMDSDILYVMNIYANVEIFPKQQWSNPTYPTAVYSVMEY